MALQITEILWANQYRVSGDCRSPVWFDKLFNYLELPSDRVRHETPLAVAGWRPSSRDPTRRPSRFHRLLSLDQGQSGSMRTWAQLKIWYREFVTGWYYTLFSTCLPNSIPPLLLVFLSFHIRNQEIYRFFLHIFNTRNLFKIGYHVTTFNFIVLCKVP